MHQTYLFVPGESRRKIEKAIDSSADAVIFDLEDGVAARNKGEARSLVASVLEAMAESPPRNKTFLVRCNAVSSPHFAEDAEMFGRVRPGGVMIAKCETPEEVAAVAGVAPGAELVPLIESALGVVNFAGIAASGMKIRRAAFGAVDFALDIGAEWSASGEERRHAMGELVLRSRAAGLEAPIDAVFPVLDDAAAFRSDAEYGRRLGFYGKMVIHPRQIEWVREVYGVSAEQLLWSRRVVELYESESARGTGSMELDGKLIDLPVYKKALRMVASAGEGGAGERPPVL